MLWYTWIKNGSLYIYCNKNYIRSTCILCITFTILRRLWTFGEEPPCPVRSDRQTTSLTLTTGVCEACTKWRGCEHHEYSLWRRRFTDCGLEVTLRSDCLACRSWAGKRGGSELIAHIRDIKESAGSRQLDRWRWGGADNLETHGEGCSSRRKRCHTSEECRMNKTF